MWDFNLIEFFRSEDNISITAALALVVAVVLAFLAPSEQTLGSALKLVFMHAALMWVSFFMFSLGAILSLIYLIGGRKYIFFWGQASLGTAMILLFATGVLGTITAKITWGGIFWQEPRMAMLGKMLLVSVFVLILSRLISSTKILAVVQIVLVGAVWWLLLSTQKIIHPNSPIFSSRDISIKIFPLAITVVLGIMALQIARGLSLYRSQR